MATATLDLKLNPAKAAMNAAAADTVASACAGRDSVLEPKLDGYRLLCYIGEDGPHLYTRNGNDKAAHLPHVVEALLANPDKFPVGTWLDGEATTLAVEDGTVHDWGSLQSILGGNPKHRSVAEHASYTVFDLLAHRGIDARSLPFKARRGLLENLLADDCGPITLIPQLPATEEAHAQLLATGFEGSMVKWLDAPYRSGARGHGQFKLKGMATIDAIITGAKPGKNGFTGMVGSLIFSQYDDEGRLVERGHCSGMTFAMRRWLTDNLDSLVAKRQVIEIRHMGRLPGTEGLRHPQFKRIRDDKAPEDVIVHDA